MRVLKDILMYLFLIFLFIIEYLLFRELAVFDMLYPPPPFNTL